MKGSRSSRRPLCGTCPGRQRCAHWREGIGVCRYCKKRCACGYSAHILCAMNAAWRELVTEGKVPA